MSGRIDWRLAGSIAAGLLAAAAVLGLVWLLVALRHLVVLLFLAVLVAATASRPVGWLERHRVPIGVAVGLVFLAAFLLAGLLALLVVPPLVQQALALRDQLPSLAQHLERFRRLSEQLGRDYPELAPFRPQLATLAGQWLAGLARWLMTLPQRAFATLLDLVAVLALSSVLIVQRRGVLAVLLAATPHRHRPLVHTVARELWRRLGAYVGAKLTVMGIVGAATALVLWPLGVPSPLLLGLVVALGELVPRIGPWLARVPLFALAALAGWVPLAVTVVSSVVIQNLKGLLIAPLVEGERLDVHPLVALLAVLAGAELFGVAGAALALPAAAALDVLSEYLLVPAWRRWTSRASERAETS